MCLGEFLLELNRLRAAMKESASSPPTHSKCMALVARQINRAMYPLIVLAPRPLLNFKTMSLPKSIPQFVNGRSRRTRGSGKSPINWDRVCPLKRMHTTHLWTYFRISFLPPTIQYSCRRMFESRVGPACKCATWYCCISK